MNQPHGTCFSALTRVRAGSTSFFPAGLQVSQGESNFVYFCVPATAVTITVTIITTVASTTPTEVWSADTENK